MTILDLLGPEWTRVLTPLLQSEYFSNLLKFISLERQTKEVIPEKGSPLIFKAFRTTWFSRVKVVILGQDPYHDGKSFDGFAFSNPPSKLTISPSLRNIQKEIERDVYKGLALNPHTDLTPWAIQGVLLINTAHTVIKGKPESHLVAWEPFTKEVIKTLQGREDLVWLLWGKYAQSYKHLITNKSHCVISSGHPSPLNRANPFIGSGCFTKCNEELEARNKAPINW